MRDGNPAPAEAGGPVKLAVVLVQLPIGAAHGLVVRFAVVQAFTLPLTRLTVDHAVVTQAAVLVLAGAGKAMASSESCREETGRGLVSVDGWTF